MNRYTLELLHTQLKESINSFNILAKAFVQNTEIALEERWDFYIKSEIGGHESSIYSFKNLKLSKNENWMEYEEGILVFYIERYKICNLVKEINEINIDKLLKEDALFVPTVEQINEIKEALLKSYIRTFTFDW